MVDPLRALRGPGESLESGAKLWRQYQKALKAYRRGATDFLPV